MLVFDATSLVAQTEEENGALLSAALTAAGEGDWDSAAQASGQITDPVAADIIQWTRLRKGKGNWSAYEDFVTRNADWPGLKLLRNRGEPFLPLSLNSIELTAFFHKGLPQSAAGALKLAAALASEGTDDRAKEVLIDAWTSMSMTAAEQAQMLTTHKDLLAEHHVARMDMLIWRGLTKQAERMYRHVSDDQVRLAQARIGLRRKVGGVDSLIAAVPAALTDDSGLAYERFLWRSRKDRWDDAEELLLERTGSEASLGEPENWANRRRRFARRAMRLEEYSKAYTLASQHFLVSGSDYADLEWLSGYLALRKLDRPEQALIHFTNFRAAVETPISYGRAGYWIGLTHQTLGDEEAAAAAFAFGAQYQTSFYGQLAAEAGGIDADPSLSGTEDQPDWRTASFADAPVIRAALLYHYAGLEGRALQFFLHASESLDAVELGQLAGLAMEIERPFFAVKISKKAARMGHVLPYSYFPVTDLARFAGKVLPELAMSIARRESELNQTVVSPAGALGLMQLMPATARKVANDIGVPYVRSKLTSDWEYNAQLGTTYLAEMLDRFRGSYILAFAAYNAGPHRADRWIETYGDPRDPDVDNVDWIEHIPFRETRNYVMRVMESVHVYRARIKGKTVPLRLVKDLSLGRS